MNSMHVWSLKENNQTAPCQRNYLHEFGIARVKFLRTRSVWAFASAICNMPLFMLSFIPYCACRFASLNAALSAGNEIEIQNNSNRNQKGPQF